ncbi:4Fe-4S binding protein [Methanoplanus endosymbiosus]|uniref:4Fe-4S binding protein n=1 Tax=Methanoplanus endosymbiosus TaxID=33865 RepID=A0A9E7PNN0_9EURY|nr:4Fe-4S binding protein [Methanoplanus endosymbiosus]UUX93619.1 4Fe-4S binding protein [Methanoplanus endosymbiosus]
MPADIFPKFIGFAYAFIVIILLAYLWNKKLITRKKTIPILILSTLLGFLVFAPIAPHNFQSLILKDTARLGGPLIIATIGMAAMLLMTLIFGRIFCGHICPVGTVQELASLAPTPKFGRKLKRETISFRAIVFVIIIAAAYFYSYAVVDLFGIYEFFHLTAGILLIVFILIIIASAFFYRPFCRLICPYGTLLAIFSAYSVLGIQRGSECIKCGKCEKVCPVDEAKIGDMGAECYMCGRCLEVCPKSGAIWYGRPEKKERK